MNNRRIDLFLGSDMGLWALHRFTRDQIGNVITLDEVTATESRAVGIPTHLGNANALCYVPSDRGLSIHYPRLLRAPLLAKYDAVYNLHPGYLPWGRGYYPVFWALWEGTPAGPTLHKINIGIDEGPIVDQIQVPYGDGDTGGSLFERVRAAEKELLRVHLPSMTSPGPIDTRRQSSGGTYHSRQEFLDLKNCVDWRNWNGQQLVKLVRCLTIPHYPGLEVVLGDETFEIKLQRPIGR